MTGKPLSVRKSARARACSDLSTRALRRSRPYTHSALYIIGLGMVICIGMHAALLIDILATSQGAGYSQSQPSISGEVHTP